NTKAPSKPGANTATPRTPWGQVPTSSAARRAGPAREDPNRRSDDGTTPLMWAVNKGDAVAVSRRLQLGANPKLANNYGASPMILAAETGNAEILKMLLEAGADPESPNPE